MILADLHNHTRISHGEASAAQMYAAAARAPLEYYGFSEHSPLPPGFSCPLYHGDLAADFPAYVRDVLALKETGAGPAGAAGRGIGLDTLQSGLDAGLCGRVSL